jgi:formylglycine-generating enzyme required for sulfatase activity
MGGGSMVRIAWVLAVSGLAGVVASARGLDQAVEPPGTVAEPPRNAVEPPRSAAKTPKKLTGPSRTAAGRSKKAARPPKPVRNSIEMLLVRVPAGEFDMGSPASDRDAQPNERPRHRVRITRPFYLGIYEVTQQEYQRVTGTNPSSEKLSPRQPVESVSWFDAVEFCNRLSAKENLPPYYEVAGKTVSILGGNGYRLPTEAEWEYACRAGSITKWSCGDDVQELALYAWHKGNAGSHSHEVGEKLPNAFGLYDMHGHMWEWCWDWYGEDYYKHSPADDPQGPSSGSVRVERGGDGWSYDPPFLRSASRNHQFPSGRFRDLGFRVARTSGEAPSPPPVEDRGPEGSPTQVLKERGLEWKPRGTPPCWVLEEESAVLARFRSVQAQEKRLDGARTQLRQLAAGGQNRRALIAAWQAQSDAIDGEITGIDQELDKLGAPANNAPGLQYHNLLVQRHTALLGQRRRLGAMINSLSPQGGDFQEQLRQFGEEVEAMGDSHRKAVEELRDAVAEIKTRYEELAADEEVAKALSGLSATTTKVPQRLGPSRDLKEVIKALDRTAGGNRAGTPAKKGRKTN